MRLKVKAFLFIFFFYALLQPASADSRGEIELAYQQTYRAAALKYRSGMFAHRAADFRAYDRDGVIVDPRKERAWLYDFLDKALTVKETGEIVDFHYLSDNEIECEVVDTIEAETFSNLQKRELEKVKIVTRSRDSWTWTSTGWKQTSCRLLEQSYSTTPKGK